MHERTLNLSLPSGYSIVEFSGRSVKNFRAKVKIPADECAQFVDKINRQYFDGAVYGLEDTESRFPTDRYQKDWWNPDLTKVTHCWELFRDHRLPNPYLYDMVFMFFPEDTVSGESAGYFYIKS